MLLFHYSQLDIFDASSEAVPEKQHNGSSARLGVRERVEHRVGVRALVRVPNCAPEFEFEYEFDFEFKQVALELEFQLACHFWVFCLVRWFAGCFGLIRPWLPSTGLGGLGIQTELVHLH